MQGAVVDGEGQRRRRRRQAAGKIAYACCAWSVDCAAVDGGGLSGELCGGHQSRASPCGMQALFAGALCTEDVVLILRISDSCSRERRVEVVSRYFEAHKKTVHLGQERPPADIIGQYGSRPSALVLSWVPCFCDRATRNSNRNTHKQTTSRPFSWRALRCLAHWRHASRFAPYFVLQRITLNAAQRSDPLSYPNTHGTATVHSTQHPTLTPSFSQH